MRVFKERNLICDEYCPICGKNENKETVLISIAGTQKGRICEAIQVCLDCLELTYDKELNVIYQKLK